MNKVTAKIAANYLGGRWTYEMLTWMLRQDAEKGTGKAPFGKAVHRKNWSYYIFPEELVKYKHGYCPGREETRRNLLSFLKSLMRANRTRSRAL